MDSILSVREPPAKSWKGSQRGEVCGALLGRCDAPQFSRGGASPEPMPHEIAQSNSSPATDDRRQPRKHGAVRRAARGKGGPLRRTFSFSGACREERLYTPWQPESWIDTDRCSCSKLPSF